MNMKFMNWLLVGAMALGAAACQDHDDTNPKASDPRGDEYTVTTPAEISDSRAMELTASHQKFAVNLTAELASEGKNIVISPLSIYNCMAMLANGADGETLEQILQVLGAKNREEVVALCRRQLDNFAAIEAKNPEIKRPDDSIFPDDMPEDMKEEIIQQMLKELESMHTKAQLANSIWYDAQHVGAPYQSYVDECKQWLDADAKSIDFEDISAGDMINQWVKDHTNGLIPQIVPFGPMFARMVSVNALYLNIKWYDGFSKTDDKMDFTNSDGTKAKAVGLVNTTNYVYTETADAQMIDIPLGTVEKQMTYTIILPKAEGVDATAMLPHAARGTNALTSTQLIKLTMPEFEITTDLTGGIAESLKNLGMMLPFDSKNANFSRMAPFKCWLDQVAHSAYIHVCESGIEAAASTANMIAGSPYPPKPKEPMEINVDRPFAFRITDNVTGMILFMGTVNQL